MRRKRGFSVSKLLQPEILWRILCYGFLILILASAEVSFFPSLRFLPASPDLLLGAVAAVSLLDSRRASLVFAIAAGLLGDAIGGVGAPISAILYVAVAAISGAWGEKMLERYGSYLVLMLPSLLLRAGFLTLTFLFGGSFSGLWLFATQRLAPHLFVTAVASLPLYFLAKLSMLPFREKRRLGDWR